MGSALKNWWTTGIGVALGVATYLSTAGVKMPETKAEWIALGIGVLMAALGAAAKDGTAPSVPK